MASHDILSMCDRALCAYIISRGAGTRDNTFPGKRSLFKTLACTICHSDQFTALDCYSGTSTVMAAIMLKSSAVIEDGQTQDDPWQAASARVKPVYDLFYENELNSGEALGEAITQAARSSTAPGDEDLKEFTCTNCEVKGGTAGTNPRSPIVAQGNAWIDTLHIEMVACPGDVNILWPIFDRENT